MTGGYVVQVDCCVAKCAQVLILSIHLQCLVEILLCITMLIFFQMNFLARSYNLRFLICINHNYFVTYQKSVSLGQNMTLVPHLYVNSCFLFVCPIYLFLQGH